MAFPLCNIKVKDIQSIFKPEYIFPQFLMQWISEHRIGSIEYRSTQIEYSQFENSNSLVNFTNLAIPAKSTKASGPCDILKSNIKLSEPISWQNLQFSFPSLEFPSSESQSELSLYRMIRKVQVIELIKTKKVKYNATVLGLWKIF